MIPEAIGTLDLAQMALQTARTFLLRARGAERMGNPSQHFLIAAEREMERARTITLEAITHVAH